MLVVGWNKVNPFEEMVLLLLIPHVRANQ